MSIKRDTWLLPRLRSQAVEPFLLALAPHFALAAQLELRLRLDASGSLVVMVPKPLDSMTLDTEALFGRLSQSFEAAGRLASELKGLPIQSRNLEDEPSLTEGMLAYLWSCVQPAVPVGTDSESGAVCAVVEAHGEARAAAFAAIARRTRDVRFMAGGDGVTLMDIDDDPAQGATLVGLRAAGLPSGVTLLHRHILAAISVWLPEGRVFETNGRVAISELLNGLADAGLLHRHEDLFFIPGPDDTGRAFVAAGLQQETMGQEQDDLVPVETLSSAITGPEQLEEFGPALRMRLHRLRPDAEAQHDLNARLNDRRFPLGYRISLDPIRNRSDSDDDIERLQAEIDERQARIALIHALARPQKRLLRFSDAQLPALVDGLRRMPHALREDAGLLYAASHAADRAEPAHFVLYDPERVQFDGILPEFYWRAVGEDHPIGFWLDPHAEEARRDNPTEPMVFVPNGHRILPYINSFGSSVSGTLRLVLGSLFADASVVLDDKDAQPAFVFSSLSGMRDEIGVEVIDLARFAPLHLRLRWINEHILVSSPNVADPDELRELAETLYAGQLARDMRKTMAAEIDGLRHEWQQAQAEMVHCLDRLTDAVADEVDRVRAQFDTARRFVDMSRDRVARVTGTLNGLGTALGALDSEMIVMLDEVPAMASARLAFFQQYEAEVASGNRLMHDAEQEITVLKGRVDALRESLGLL